MPALASTDLTITVQDVGRGSLQQDKRHLVKIAFGDGLLTYPSGGVPLPGFASFGFTRNLAYVVLIDPNDASGIVWKVDYENQKLRGYIQGAVISAAGSSTLDDFPLNTTTDPDATASLNLGLANTGAAAGTVYFGKLKELSTTHAPAAQVLYAEAVGW